MRINVKGIHWTLGSSPTARRKFIGKRGGTARASGQYGTPEFIASYNEAIAQRAPTAEGRLQSLIQGYQRSQKFLGRSERTRADYIRQIEIIEKEFGDFPLKALAARETRGVFMDWRDRLALKSVRQADYAFTVLALIFAWAKDRGKICVSPCEKGGRLYSGTRVDCVWTIHDEAAFPQHAPAHLHLPLLLALWTGQRQGDLLRLTWSAYDGNIFACASPRPAYVYKSRSVPRSRWRLMQRPRPSAARPFSSLGWQAVDAGRIPRLVGQGSGQGRHCRRDFQ